jgi:hypothetical protein
MRRRQYLTATGVALASSLGGCASSNTDPGSKRTSGSQTDGNSEESATDRPAEPIDAENYSIDGRLHNETGEAKNFTVTIKDADGTVLKEEEHTVGPTGTYLLPSVGEPGATEIFDVSVGKKTAAKTLTFDVGSTPQKVDGYVDISFTSTDELTITFTPLDYPHDTVITPEPRVDTPPQEITRPARPDNPNETDDWDQTYLGTHIATSPTVEYTTVTRSRGVLPPRTHDTEGDIYWAELISSEQMRDALLDLAAVDEGTRSHLLNVDFEESVLVAVETGYGSGSVEHRWARVESTEKGLALVGYYTDPYIQTDDLTTRVSLVEVFRPATEVEIAHVHLTVSEKQRIHFNSTEGLVTITSA